MIANGKAMIVVAAAAMLGGCTTIPKEAGFGEVQKAVAERLSSEWAKEGIRVLHIDSYYDDRQQIARLLKEGRSRETIGQHASLIDTSELLSINPKGVDLVRYRNLIYSIRPSGVTGDPSDANASLGMSLFEMRVAAAVSQIKASLASR